METFSALLAICAGNSPVPGEFPAQRPVARSFDVFVDLHPNKRLSKQWWGWWFETPPCPLRGHRNDNLWTEQIMTLFNGAQRRLDEADFHSLNKIYWQEFPLTKKKVNQLDEIYESFSVLL